MLYTLRYCISRNIKILKMQNFIIKITQESADLTADERIGCFILSDALNPDFVAAFSQKARSHGKLVLTSGKDAVENYVRYGVDGFVIDTTRDSEPHKVLRELKKRAPQAIVGVVVRNRRHEAMLVSECEPDFVIFKVWQDGFEANRELLSWYADLFLIQCAAQPEEPLDWKNLPVDFVIIEDTEYAIILASGQNG